MNARPYLYVSSFIFAVVGALHLLRAIEGWPVQVAGSVIPVGWSWLGMLVAGALAIWGLTLARRAL
jgi:hypothetical protein